MISFLLSVAFAADPNTPTNPPPVSNPPTQTPPSTGTGTGTTGTGTTGTQPTTHLVFDDLDANKDGSLEKTEIAQNQMLVRDFAVIDTDKSGKLSRTELQAWETRQGTMGTTGQAANAPLFEDLDVNKDMNIEKSELTQLTDLTRDFSTYDVDKNGKLSRTEFLSWRATVGLPVFTDLDLNKDGVLDSSEINKNESIKRDLTIIDTDKNGRISKEEYQVWTAKAGRG